MKNLKRALICLVIFICAVCNLSANSIEKIFWNSLSDINKVIYARGLLDGLVSGQIVSYIILSELEQKSVQLEKTEVDIRNGIINEYRDINQYINKAISDSYSVEWQNNLIQYIDSFYMDPKNIDESISTAFFYYLDDTYSWGYKPKK